MITRQDLSSIVITRKNLSSIVITGQHLSSIVITRQARHDLLEKYRPRILMTEAELAEDAVIITTLIILLLLIMLNQQCENSGDESLCNICDQL